MKIYVDKNALQDYTTKLIAKEKTIFATKNEVGSPLVASTVAGMTDHDKIYVYVGSETGYTSGNWYYWDGTAWTSGGVYNSEGFVLDDTLTSATEPAQAKAVGDKISELSEEIEIADHLYNSTLSANSRWPRFALNVTSGTTYTIFISNVIATGTYDKVYVVQGTTDLTGNIPIGGSASFTPDGNDPVYLTVRFDATPSVLPKVIYYFYQSDTWFRSVTGCGLQISNTNKGAICNGDCNDMPNNTIFSVTGGTSLSHDPGFSAFYNIVTIGKGAFRSAGDFQFATQVTDGSIKFRTYYNSTNGWSDWGERITESKFKYAVQGNNTNIADDNKAAICNGDYNDLPSNVIYGVSGAASLSHAPWSGLYTLVITFGKNPTIRTAGDYQIAIDALNNIVAYRTYYNSTNGWSAWTINNFFPIESDFSGIEMFERFGVIGDSFASGDIVTSGSSYEVYSLSWPQMLARMSGSTGINYSAGGYGTYKFVDSSDPKYNTYCYGKMVSDINNNQGCGLYLCCMGLNDSNSQKTFGDKTGGLDYLGTSADINLSDYTQNANSFWGNYGKIIQTIKTISPNSRIVMCTFCRVNTGSQYAYNEYNQAIQQIAEFFGLPCITLTDDKFFASDFYINKLVSNHPTAPQYVGYAKAVERLLSRCIVNNYNYFKEYVGV